jgi:hypothetical protein
MSEETKKEEQRTAQQNKALHLWCEKIAEAYNDQGLTINVVLTKFKNMELYWSKESVKEIIIKTAMKRMLFKDSTTQLLKNGSEIEKLVDVVTKFNAQMGIEYIPFPSEENVEEIVKN